MNFIENLPPSMIDNIRGKATIKTQHQWAFVLSSGLCQVVKMDLTDKHAHIILRRVSQKWAFDFEKKITIEELKTKGLTKNPVYRTYPLQMLQWRCIGDLIKLGFPDCVLGLPQYTQEELAKDDQKIIIDDTTFDEDDDDSHSDQGLIDQIYESQLNMNLDNETESSDRVLIATFLDECKLTKDDKLHFQRFAGYNWRTYQETISMLNQSIHPLILIKGIIDGSRVIEGTDKDTLRDYLKTGELF